MTTPDPVANVTIYTTHLCAGRADLPNNFWTTELSHTERFTIEGDPAAALQVGKVGARISHGPHLRHRRSRYRGLEPEGRGRRPGYSPERNGTLAPAHEFPGTERFPHVSALTEFRTEKDTFFRTHPDSPLPHGQRSQFRGRPTSMRIQPWPLSWSQRSWRIRPLYSWRRAPGIRLPMSAILVSGFDIDGQPGRADHVPKCRP